MIGIVFVFSGILGSYLMGLWMDKTKNTLLGLKLSSIGMQIIYFGSLYLIPLGNFPLTTVLAFFIGLLNVPILPAGYGFAAEITIGTPVAVVNGLMMNGGELYSFFFSYLSVYLLGISQLTFLAWMCGMSIIGTLCILFVKKPKSAEEQIAEAEEQEKGLLDAQKDEEE